MSAPRRAIQPARRPGITTTVVTASLALAGGVGALFLGQETPKSIAINPEDALTARAGALATAAESLAASRAEAALVARQESLSMDSSDVVLLAKKEGYGGGVFTRPAAGKVVSPFGYRIHPVFRVRTMHEGIDISASCGDPIYAADDGVVTKTGYQGGAGNSITVTHQPGLDSLYYHLSSYAVRQGDQVKRGQLIGKAGSTGTSTGCHLHFQVEKDKTPVDPIPYLTP